MSELSKAIKEQGRHISAIRGGFGTTDAINALDELADMFEAENATLNAQNAMLREQYEAQRAAAIDNKNWFDALKSDYDELKQKLKSL